MDNQQSIYSLIVLCGGQGSRLGGAVNINDKSDLQRPDAQVVQIDAQSTLIGYDLRHERNSCQ